MEPYPILLGGENKQTPETIQVRFPFTGELYAQVF